MASAICVVLRLAAGAARAGAADKPIRTRPAKAAAAEEFAIMISCPRAVAGALQRFSWCGRWSALQAPRHLASTIPNVAVGFRANFGKTAKICLPSAATPRRYGAILSSQPDACEDGAKSCTGTRGEKRRLVAGK
ncbi:hypothetical protein [Methylorubrum aminovorans]|uniref:hypothetical protein n=1 Tax=Methylorubrum aminovorans TaxID=269069 RepID=UPI0024E16854|nr:hypothetical protein [Methylorubrum aminovorans]